MVEDVIFCYNSLMHIEIEIPRPWSLLLCIGGIVGAVAWFNSGFNVMAMGGSLSQEAQVIRTQEDKVRDLRLEQEVLSRREMILRAELSVLEDAMERTYDADTLAQLTDTRARLLQLLSDKRAGEQAILASLRQIWEAQAFTLSLLPVADASIDHPLPFRWPVEPALGISASFDDEGYRARFGIPHKAIDIPVTQGSVVVAAADGRVMKATDNGLGFNALVIRHAAGYATLYGHVSAFLVEEGQEVRAGDPVALSGGTPGTKGAGNLTTGAHLHFEVIKDGAQTDPLPLLQETEVRPFR